MIDVDAVALEELNKHVVSKDGISCSCGFCVCGDDHRAIYVGRAVAREMASWFARGCPVKLPCEDWKNTP